MAKMMEKMEKTMEKMERVFRSKLFWSTLCEAGCEDFADAVKELLAGRRDQLLGVELFNLADLLEEAGNGWYDDCAGPVREAAELCTEVPCLALCASRHPMPDVVKGSIFPMEVDPTDFREMQRTACRSLKTGGANSIKEVTVYVTGLTAALVAVINTCHRNGIKLTLMHFDRASGEYLPQQVS